MKLSLFVKATLISWVILFLIGVLISNYPLLVVGAFTLIVSIWIGFFIDLLFGGEGGSGSGGDDGGWAGAC